MGDKKLKWVGVCVTGGVTESGTEETDVERGYDTEEELALARRLEQEHRSVMRRVKKERGEVEQERAGGSVVEDEDEGETLVAVLSDDEMDSVIECDGGTEETDVERGYDREEELALARRLEQEHRSVMRRVKKEREEVEQERAGGSVVEDEDEGETLVVVLSDDEVDSVIECGRETEEAVKEASGEVEVGDDGQGTVDEMLSRAKELLADAKALARVVWREAGTQVAGDLKRKVKEAYRMVKRVRAAERRVERDGNEGECEVMGEREREEVGERKSQDSGEMGEVEMSVRNEEESSRRGRVWGKAGRLEDG